MRDYLKDIIEHTSALGIIDLVKVTGTQAATSVNAIADDRTVIVSGLFKTPDAEFDGVFGMPNLGKLRTILGFDEYDNSSKITLTREDRDGVITPSTIHFESASSDFINDYRLMSKSLIEERIRDVTFKGTGWNVEFEPSLSSIQRLKKQSQANSEQTTFTTKVENGDLKVFFGDPSTHSGNFVFQAGVTGTLSRAWQWPVSQVMSILSLPGDKKLRITDQGAMSITVDSGMADWEYLVPALTK